MGKNRLSFRKLISRRTKNSPIPPPRSSLITSSSPPLAANEASNALSVAAKGKKKGGGAAMRLWMRFDLLGNSELVECDKTAIVNRVSIPGRDLRILGPVFSQSSNILAREKAMVVNLEFVRAIVTAEEVLILDPLRHEVIPFVDRLRILLSSPKPDETLESELPFEFQILETALEVVCSHLDISVGKLERDAYPVLDELARNVSNKNLEHVRSLKSTLTRLLARVQKVRDEIEHLLDDDEDMGDLYLSRKKMQLTGSSPRVESIRSGSQTTGSFVKSDVEDLEMLLESYFMQLDGTRNKLLSVREYIDDTEDYVNIQLDNQRNELIQLQLTLTIASFALAVDTLIAGIFGMNIPFILYQVQGIFSYFVAGTSFLCLTLFLLILLYAKHKMLLS